MKKLLIIIISIYLAGCASPYARSVAFGGYSETQYKENVFEVMFDGNGFTSWERSTDLCLLRCAELCKKNGYKYFVIVDNSDVEVYDNEYYIGKPIASNTIRCLKEKPAYEDSFEAEVIIESISTKYNINLK